MNSEQTVAEPIITVARMQAILDEAAFVGLNPPHEVFMNGVLSEMVRVTIDTDRLMSGPAATQSGNQTDLDASCQGDPAPPAGHRTLGNADAPEPEVREIVKAMSDRVRALIADVQESVQTLKTRGERVRYLIPTATDYGTGVNVASFDQVVAGLTCSPQYLEWFKSRVKDLKPKQQAHLRNLLNQRDVLKAQDMPQTAVALQDAWTYRPGMPEGPEFTDVVWPIARALDGTESPIQWRAEADEVEKISRRMWPGFVAIDQDPAIDRVDREAVRQCWLSIHASAHELRKIASVLRALSGHPGVRQCDSCHRHLPLRSGQIRRCPLHGSGAGNRRDMYRLTPYEEQRSRVETEIVKTGLVESCRATLAAKWVPWSLRVWIELRSTPGMTAGEIHRAILTDLDEVHGAVMSLLTATEQITVSGPRKTAALPCINEWMRVKQEVVDRASRALAELGAGTELPLTQQTLRSTWARAIEQALPRRILSTFYAGLRTVFNDSNPAVTSDQVGSDQCTRGQDPEHPLARWNPRRQQDGLCEEDTSAAKAVEDLIRLAAWERVGGRAVDEALESGHEIPLFQTRRRLDADQAVQLRSQGARLREIAEQFGVSVQAVTMALQRRRRDQQADEQLKNSSDDQVQAGQSLSEVLAVIQAKVHNMQTVIANRQSPSMTGPDRSQGWPPEAIRQLQASIGEIADCVQTVRQVLRDLDQS
jgi:hypothetical protein